jgi:hypothetical protein
VCNLGVECACGGVGGERDEGMRGWVGVRERIVARYGTHGEIINNLTHCTALHRIALQCIVRTHRYFNFSVSTPQYLGRKGRSDHFEDELQLMHEILAGEEGFSVGRNTAKC